MFNKYMISTIFNFLVNVPPIMTHRFDRKLTQLRVSFLSSQDKKDQVIGAYKERLISRFYKSLDKGSEYIEKMHNYPSGSIQFRRREVMAETVKSLRNSPVIL